MAKKGLWIKEIGSGRFKFFLGLLVLGAMAVALPLMYDFIVGFIRTAPVPEPFKAQAAMLGDYRLYIWSQWFGKNLYQFGSIMAIVFGAGLISSEVSRKTIQFLLSKPVRRQDVFAAKYIVNYLALALVIIISTIMLYITVIVTGHKYPVSDLAQNLITALAGLAVIFSVSVFFSTLFDQSLKPAVFSMLAALLLAVPGFFPAIQKYSVYYHMSGFDIVRGEGFPIIPLAVMVAVSAALYALGRQKFCRRDF